MIIIQENINIESFTTFKVPAFCKYFVKVNTVEELNEALDFCDEKKISLLVLGGGSNVLFTKKFNGLVVQLNLKGLKINEESHQHIIISAMAGEYWHSFVKYCVNHNYGGLENLSLIPGNVGTSPVQNIGAYGVEIKDTFNSLLALNISTRKIESFSNNQCEFGYRDSIFKNIAKNKYIILEVRFKLTTKNHILNYSYGAIKEELNKHKIVEPTIKDISKAIVNIRRSKLPDPMVLGNAGSFFKNPTIPLYKFKNIQKIYSEIPHYILSHNTVKIPAAWLIEKVGWKGKKVGNVGVHEKQALVLVNYGGGIGEEIYQLSEQIIRDVNKLFDILLEREVNIII